jgi:hypothetical protein
MNILNIIQLTSLALTAGIYLLFGNYLKYEYNLTSTAIFDTPIYKNEEIVYKMKAVYNSSVETDFYANDINTLYQYQPEKSYTSNDTPATIGLIVSISVFIISSLVLILDWISQIKFPNKPKNIQLWLGLCISISVALVVMNYQSTPVEIVNKNVSKIPVSRIYYKSNEIYRKLYYEIIVNYDKDWVNKYYTDTLEKAIAFQPDKIYYAPNINHIIGVISTIISIGGLIMSL